MKGEGVTPSAKHDHSGSALPSSETCLYCRQCVKKEKVRNGLSLLFFVAGGWRLFRPDVQAEDIK